MENPERKRKAKRRSAPAEPSGPQSPGRAGASLILLFQNKQNAIAEVIAHLVSPAVVDVYDPISRAVGGSPRRIGEVLNSPTGAAARLHILASLAQSHYSALCRGNNPMLQKRYGALAQSVSVASPLCLLRRAFGVCAVILEPSGFDAASPETYQKGVEDRIAPAGDRAAVEILRDPRPCHKERCPSVREMNPDDRQFAADWPGELGPPPRGVWGSRKIEAKLARIFCASCARLARTLRCQKCRQAGYCGPACQKAHWAEHKKVCAQARRAKTPGPLDVSEGKSCAMCASPDARHRCGRCHRTNYCSRVCQAAHWRGHRLRCPKPENA